MKVQQTVAAAEQSLTEIGMVFGAVVIIAFTFSYAVTHFAKAWRNDHAIALLSPSSSLLRATLLAFAAFEGLWYSAFSLGMLAEHSWLVAIILGIIISPIAPLIWNPLVDFRDKLVDALISRMSK